MLHPSLFCLDDIPECDRTESHLVNVLEALPANSLTRDEFQRLAPHMTPAVIRAVVKNNSRAISGLRAMTPAVITAALVAAPKLFLGDLLHEHDPRVPVFSKDFTDEQLNRIVRSVPAAIAHIANPSEQLCLTAVSSAPLVIEFIEQPSEAVMRQAITVNSLSVLKIKHPPHAVVHFALSRNPLLLGADTLVPRTIDATTIDLYERAIGHNRHYQMLYSARWTDPKEGEASDVAPMQPSVRLPLTAILDPSSRQLECLVRTVEALDVSIDRKRSFSQSLLILDFLIPSLHALPLGKRYREAWRQPDGNGQWLLEWLEPLIHHSRGLVKQFQINNRQALDVVERCLARAAAQIELGITSDIKEGPPAPGSSHAGIDDTL